MTPVVRLLLTANVGVFFMQLLRPGFEGPFAFTPQLAFVRPWTAITYMFLHGSLMHLGFNMLALFFFGPRVEARMGSRRFAILYFVSGLSGALLSLLLGPLAPVIGASGAVFGVMFGFAHFWPAEPIHIWGIVPVPARLLVIFTTILALYSGFAGTGSGIAHFAHLGGYAGAFVYLKWIERKRGEWRRKATAAPRLNGAIGRRPVIDLTTVHEANRAEINRLLDKVAAGGMESLSNEERLFLSNFIPRELH